MHSLHNPTKLQQEVIEHLLKIGYNQPYLPHNEFYLEKHGQMPINVFHISSIGNIIDIMHSAGMADKIGQFRKVMEL